MTPAIVIYTDRFVRHGGVAYGPIVLVRPRYRHDKGLHAHERTHVRQWWRTFGLMSIVYPISRRWRCRWEVEAFQAQLEHAPDALLTFADFLATWYRLDIDRADALRLIRGSMDC